MMESIVEEKLVSFKTLEQKIFSYVCELGREITTIMLETYDKELADGRDKKNYRNKGTRTTTIKTVYGEVTYGRRVYQTKLEDGKKAYVYLLDEAMQMDNMAKNQKSYTPEFKQQIVDLYNAGGTSYPQLEREYGVNRSTLGN